MEETARVQCESVPSSSSTTASAIGDPSSSLVRNEENNRDQEEDSNSRHGYLRRRLSSAVSYRVNIISLFDAPPREQKDDVWSCLVVLVTFWFFASMTLILGLYGTVNLQLGPNCSRLIQINGFLVQYIQSEELNEMKPGPMLYGFSKPPPLDIEIAWSETHNVFVQANLHEEWAHFLNEGSKVEILYDVKSSSSLPLSLVIAQGRDSLVDWIEDPSLPNTTLSWNIIYGSGKIQQEIYEASNYYIALANFNTKEVEVELKFNINALVYNTSQAYYKCSLDDHLCRLKLFLTRKNSAVLTTPGPNKGNYGKEWLVKLSYGPRWITYFIGSGLMTALILSSFKVCNQYQNDSVDSTEFQTEEVVSQRAPLLTHKYDDDVLSWGSSYDSGSHHDEDLEQWLPVPNSTEGHSNIEGESGSHMPHRCVICFDALRDCFFLPCGHCAACFACGTRIAEQDGNCPICRRKMKKVRKIFTV